MKCKITSFKECVQCKRTFLDNKWCGEITCQRCLDLCWVIDDLYISERIFSCCDYHRPQISFNNMKITFDENQITEEEQNSILNDIEKRVNSINSNNIFIPDEEKSVVKDHPHKEEDLEEEHKFDTVVSSSPIINAALKIRNISKTFFK